MRELLLYLNVFFISYFFVVNGFYLCLIAVSSRVVERYARVRKLTQYEGIFDTTFYKPVSVIVPAHNEEQTIVDTVASVLAVRYPELEVVVVNDGSRDRTLQALIRAFALVPAPDLVHRAISCGEIVGVYESDTYPGLRLIDKVQGGKADALNAGINACSFPLVCNIDADSIIDVQSMVQITRPFLEDHRVIAVGGVVMPANNCVIERGEVKQVRLACRNLARFQIVEYLRAFLFGRVGWSRLNSLMIVSGAFAIFRRTALIEVGGYRTDTVGEDMELVLRMHRIYCDRKKPYRILFLPDPICWTQVPEDLRSLAKQRRRWHRGLAESLRKNSRLCLRPRYGTVGCFGYPFFVLCELLSPVIELSGYVIVAAAIITHAIDWRIALSFLAFAILLGTMFSATSLMLEEKAFKKYARLKDLLILFGYALLENFGYRQMHCFWRCQGLFDYVLRREGWGKAVRRAF